MNITAAVYKFAAAVDDVCGLWFRWPSLQLKRKVPLWLRRVVYSEHGCGTNLQLWLMVTVSATETKFAAEAERGLRWGWLRLRVATSDPAFKQSCH